MDTKMQNNGLAVAALVLGIVALVLCFVPLVGAISGILAIVFGAIARKSHRRGQAIAGIVTGSIGIVLGILCFFVVFAAMPALQRSQRDMARKLDVSNASSEVMSYQANYRGEAPTSNWLNDQSYTQINEIVSVGDPTTSTAVYTIGESCEGVTGGNAYKISVKLESGDIYCLDS